MAKLLLIGISMMVGTALAADDAVTFHRDVLPILQKNCQSCHRPNQIGPMPLLTYEEARPWARSIKAAVAKREMPPWYADPAFGEFSNDRSLSQQEIDTIVKWVDAGAPAGDAAEGPKPVAWPEAGWQIKPDVVMKGVEMDVPEKGVLDWVYVTLPLPFKEDTWVTSMEMRPGSLPKLTHHYCVFIIPHRDDVEYGVPVATDQGTATGNAPFEGCWEQGQGPFDYRQYNAARLIPGNSDIIFQMHYNPLGKAMRDQPQIGFTVTDKRPERQFTFISMGAGHDIDIKPNQADYVTPVQEGQLTLDTEIVWLQAHAHYRAKEMTFEIEYPDGREETALQIHWNPYWQLIYYPTKPKIAPEGTLLRVQGRYDNSANNKFNPDPSAPVKFGQQASDEMLFPTYGLLVDGKLDLKKVKVLQPSARADRGYTVRSEQ